MTAAATREPRRFPFVPGRSTIVSLASGEGHCSVLPMPETPHFGSLRYLLVHYVFLGTTAARSKRVLISAVDHRRPGSQLKQCFAMSSNGCGMFSGNSGSFSVVLSHAGRRFVSASTSVIPSDQISLLGDIAPVAFSGAS